MGTYLALLGLALVDSANISAILGTLYLLISTPNYRSRVLTYLTALYLVYLAIGIALMSGLTLLENVANAGTALPNDVKYGIQGAIGAALFLYGVFAKPNRPSKSRTPRNLGPAAVFAAGLGVAMIEVSTALPYFGAIALLTTEGFSLVEAIPVLVAYNVIFILPCLLLLAAFGISGGRLRTRFEAYVEKHRERNTARKALLWIAAIVGFFLLRESLFYFEFFGLVEIPDHVRDAVIPR